MNTRNKNTNKNPRFKMTKQHFNAAYKRIEIREIVTKQLKLYK